MKIHENKKTKGKEMTRSEILFFTFFSNSIDFFGISLYNS